MAGIVKLDASEFNRSMEAMESTLTMLSNYVDLISQEARIRSSGWEGDAKENWMINFVCVLDEIEEACDAARKLGEQADRLGHILEKTHRSVVFAVEEMGVYE